MGGLSLKRYVLWAIVALLSPVLAGCPGSVYLWEVRTESTTRPASFNPAVFEQEPVAVLEALAAPALHGNEAGLALSLTRILKRVVPNWKVVSPQETATRINKKGLANDYVRMRTDYEQGNILDREPLRKIGAALGVRYVFQPRLAAFTQTMYDRWKVPALEVYVVRIRSSILRLSLQLWNTESGELIWASTAEASFQEEAVSQDPVYLREAGRITWASIISDFKQNKTSSMYSPVNEFLDSLIHEEVEQETEQNKH